MRRGAGSGLRSSRRLLCLLSGAVVVLWSGGAAAQIHHVAPVPWHALGGEDRPGGVDVFWQETSDHETGWRAERWGLTFLLPLGKQGLFFLRQDFVRFDSARRRVLDRWPDVQPEEQIEATAGDPRWPYERIVDGFGQPQLGLILPLRIPPAHGGHLGLAAGLPIGNDRLYPYSSGCLPLSCDWRGAVPAGSLQVAGRVGFEHTFSSSGDELSDIAFPGGWRYGLELGHAPGRVRGASVAWAARELDDRRHERTLTLNGWLPLGEGHRVRLHVAHQFGGLGDRHADWMYGIAWLLAGSPSAE